MVARDIFSVNQLFNRVLVHFGFGRVASHEFSPAFERWVNGISSFPSRSDG